VAIQPIDLQTLYTQLDKIGKAQVMQQVADQASREAEQVTNRHESDIKVNKVQETDAGDEKPDIVHERKGSGNQEQENSQHKSGKEPKDAEKAPVEPDRVIIRDPALGTHIDISG